MTEKAIVVRDANLPDTVTVERRMAAILNFQRLVRTQLKEGHDYGRIPGMGDRDSLFKPGAEKLVTLLGARAVPQIIRETVDWEHGLFAYTVQVDVFDITTGDMLGSGLGECNSREAKYRWREARHSCPKCGVPSIIKGKDEFGGGWLCWRKQGGCGAKFAAGDKSIEGQKVGRVENDDIYSQINTILKMAKKRALVDAALQVGRLSDVFTQDLEDGSPDHTEAAGAHSTMVSPPPGEVLEGEYTSEDEKEPEIASESLGVRKRWSTAAKSAKVLGLKVPLVSFAATDEQILAAAIKLEEAIAAHGATEDSSR